jgi:hypothetical protein
LEHLLDPRPADASLEPTDDALVFDEEQSGHSLDLQAPRETGALSYVDARDAYTPSLLAPEEGNEAFHPPRGP